MWHGDMTILMFDNNQEKSIRNKKSRANPAFLVRRKNSD